MRQCVAFALILGVALFVDAFATWSLVGLCVVGGVVLVAAAGLVMNDF